MSSTLRIIRDTIFDSRETLNKKTDEGIKKRIKTKAAKSWPSLNGYIDKEANLDIAWNRCIKFVLKE